MKRLNENPEIIKIKDKNVCVLTWFNHERVLDLKETQEKVFKHLNLPLNVYFDKNLTHAKFMDYCLKNIDSDIFIFFDLDCVPMDNKIYENIVDELIKEECIIGIEQTANHLDSNFIYAGPACFGITKDLYNKLGKISFDGTHRSDIAQEYTYLCYDNNITVKFMKLVSSKNNKWKLGIDRNFGNGCFYEFKDSTIYHQFQTNLEEQKQDFKIECGKIINNPNKLKNLVIITSVLNISNNPLSYTNTRSVYSYKERLEQTINTINSLTKIENKHILFVETSEVPSEDEEIIKNKVDFYLNLKDEPKIKENVNGLFKNSGEALQILSSLNNIDLNRYDNIIKISGRYWLNENFNESLFDNEYNIFKECEAGTCFYTILYKINKKYFDKYIQALNETYQYTEQIENVFLRNFVNNCIKVNQLGVTGNISVNGELIIK